MKKILFVLAVLVVYSCTPESPNNYGNLKKSLYIGAEKTAWKPAHETKADDSLTVSNDIPWKVGEKVLLLSSDQSYEGCTVHTVDSTYNEETGRYEITSEGWSTSRPTKKTICTVSKADGLKSILIPDTPLEEGTYRAFYPFYPEINDAYWYDRLDMKFYIIPRNGMNKDSQDIMYSDPVSYEIGDSLSFVLNHFVALIDIDIYPPKTGFLAYYAMLASDAPVFPGTIQYWIDKKSLDPLSYLNFTSINTLKGSSLKEGVKCKSATSVYPLPFDGAPVYVHLFYSDGTHYVSEQLSLPSLAYGEETKLVATDFSETDEPYQGAGSETFGGPIEFDYPEWLFTDSFPSLTKSCSR